MCGLVGFWKRSGLPAEEGAALVESMAAQISHRGPDSKGIWVDGNIGIALGHRRLSVLDLSPMGHQPMVSARERFVLVFNGEIYNHLNLRAEIGEHAFRGHSDTETLLAGIECWGLEATLKKAVGMFAIALWDREDRVLSLARDRMGEKPLYYGWQGSTFLFGSELKALKVHSEFRSEIDRDVLSLLLRYGYIPAPYSIYRGIRKLVPGTILRLAHDRAVDSLQEPVHYWSIRSVVDAERMQPFGGGDSEAIEELETRLAEAVSLQRMADVPLGAFLSGGVDSSVVVALMQAQSASPIRTFTIGFPETKYNEADFAKAVAAHLGTDHTELYVTPQEAMDVIPKLPALYDEPFADSSQIPTFLVSHLARQHVTVSLSGDGGDELFGGYGRYIRAKNTWGRIQACSPSLRRGIARGIRMCPAEAVGFVVSRILALGGRRLGHPPGEIAHALADAFSCSSSEDFYRIMVSLWRSPSEVVIGAVEPPTVLTDPDPWGGIDDFEERMMYLDTLSYLPDDILVKVDRAAMGVSLETRVPLLDHRIFEFACRLPLSMKMRGGQGKWILRQVLYKYVPKELIERPKMGFGVPLDVWLRGPLREWAEDLLSENRLRREGFFDSQPIRKRWLQHISGQCNWRDSLWSVLAFQMWLCSEREG